MFASKLSSRKRRMKSMRNNEATRLNGPTMKCLTELLDAELDGEPVEAYVWRAKNAKKIPRVQELTRNRMIEGDTNYVVTFWGLMNAPGERAKSALSMCERAFKALRKHYPAHPKDPISVETLAKLNRMTPTVALQSARFLSRSPANLSIHSEGQDVRLSPNENYVVFKGFEEVKDRAREQNRHGVRAVLHGAFATVGCDRGLMQILEVCESGEVRECWQKAVERVSRDPEGAITAARSLVEAGCKHVLEEYGEKTDTHMELPKLYRTAAALLKLDASIAVDESLRRVLQASATVVYGLASLRNKLSDAHGKGRHSAKPAKRHAELIVMIAGAMTGFLLATLDAQRVP